MFPLIKTKLHRKLLAYVFTNTEEHFYVRELASFIEEDPGNLSRELIKLEKEGLFNSYIRGREKYYSLNKKYPLYKELKSIIFKTVGVEGSLRDLISKYKEITFAFIYGSYAKDKVTKTSDIDVVLVGKSQPNDFTGIIRKLESLLAREINFTFYTETEFMQEKKKKGGFLNMILKDKIIILKGKLNA